MDCNCTLLGSWACQYCPEYNKEFWTNYKIVNWTPIVLEGYDTERYELVEKKEWKINKIKENIEYCEEQRLHLEELSRDYGQASLNYTKTIMKLQEQLKELEK